jgi:type I restriction enzyme S subunit
VDPKYLSYFLNQYSFMRFASRLNAGDRPRVKFEQLAPHEFPLAPLNEQRRIVARIEEHLTRLDAGVAALKRAQANLKRYKASVLKAACEGRLVPTEAELARAEGRSYEPASELLQRILAERRAKWKTDLQTKSKAPSKIVCEEPQQPEAIHNLPDGWCWTNLDQLKEFSLYGPRFSSNDYTQFGRLVLRTTDINESGKVNLTSAPKLALGDEEFQRYRCKIGDLLITRTGSLGTAAVFNDDVEAIPGAYLIQYRLQAPFTTSWYVYYLIKSPRGQRHLIGKGAGVGRPNLNAPTLDMLPISLPPLAEQTRIVNEIESRLSVVYAIESTIKSNLARSNRLRQSILKRAFSGQLVPHDPNDEPASALLERLRAAP